jgi:hypothetical protein
MNRNVLWLCFIASTFVTLFVFSLAVWNLFHLDSYGRFLIMVLDFVLTFANGVFAVSYYKRLMEN